MNADAEKDAWMNPGRIPYPAECLSKSSHTFSDLCPFV